MKVLAMLALMSLLSACDVSPPVAKSAMLEKSLVDDYGVVCYNYLGYSYISCVKVK